MCSCNLKEEQCHFLLLKNSELAYAEWFLFFAKKLIISWMGSSLACLSTLSLA